MMDYDVIVVGAGLSGLTCASLLAKQALKVLVIDHSHQPGGSCGVFKRSGMTFDQGSSMMFGWGPKGFNGHRFVFNCLETPITMIQNEYLYAVNYQGQRIRFWADVDQFADEMCALYPHQVDNIRRFYHDMTRIYQHVMVDYPNYATPDQMMDLVGAGKAMIRHPLSYAKFLGFLNQSAKWLLERYFTDDKIFSFFDKLTSTYCYATVEEAPAILAAVMFVDNHVGGSYYAAGGSFQVPGAMEKVIEAHGGTMLMNQTVTEILFTEHQPTGVRLHDGTAYQAKYVVYSGTVWNLYGKLIAPSESTPAQRQWAQAMQPTLPSTVLYLIVKREVIPDGTAPIEFLVGNPTALDESEITCYIYSLIDQTISDERHHVIVAIGPSLVDWNQDYPATKRQEQARMLDSLEQRFPGLKANLVHCELSTPQTIERYLMKNGGAVAGPKQMLGQHMFKRMKIQSPWKRLICCGESTILGTGTPAVTISGLSAANVILKQLGMKPYIYHADQPNYVTLVKPPFTADQLFQYEVPKQKEIRLAANRCAFCEQPKCITIDQVDVPGIMRRIACGNWYGAQQKYHQRQLLNLPVIGQMERLCVLNEQQLPPVSITRILEFISQLGFE